MEPQGQSIKSFDQKTRAGVELKSTMMVNLSGKESFEILKFLATYLALRPKHRGGGELNQLDLKKEIFRKLQITIASYPGLRLKHREGGELKLTMMVNFR